MSNSLKELKHRLGVAFASNIIDAEHFEVAVKLLYKRESTEDARDKRYYTQEINRILNNKPVNLEHLRTYIKTF